MAESILYRGRMIAPDSTYYNGIRPTNADDLAIWQQAYNVTKPGVAFDQWSPFFDPAKLINQWKQEADSRGEIYTTIDDLVQNFDPNFGDARMKQADIRAANNGEIPINPATGLPYSIADDPQKYAQIRDANNQRWTQVAQQQKAASGGGGLLSGIASIASMIPGPWQIPAAVYKAGEALQKGDVLSAALAAYGGYNGISGLTDGANAGILDLADFGGSWDVGGLSMPSFGSNSGALPNAAGTGNLSSGGNMDWLETYLSGGGTPGLDIPSSNDGWFERMFPNGTSNDTGNGIGEMMGGGNYDPSFINQALNVAGQIPGGAKALISKLTGGSGSGAGGGLSAIGGLDIGKLLALGGGALLGSQSGSQQSGTSTTTTVPWAAQQPYLQDLFAGAKSALGTVGTGLSPLQQTAVTNASAANPLTQPAQDTILSSINGTLKNPMLGTNNPYLTDVIDKSNADVNRAMLPAMGAANRASGSFGNSGVADIYSRNLTDAYSKNATGLRFQDYTNQQNLNEADINRRLSSSFNAPTFGANNIANATNQFNLGTQAKTDPFNTLGKYGSLIGGSYGSAVNSPIYTNPNAGLLGGALAGAEVYKTLFK